MKLLSRFVCRRAFRRSLGFLGMLAVLVGVAAPQAQAHSGNQNYVYLNIYEREIDGNIHLIISDVETVLDLKIGNEEQGALAAAKANAPKIKDYLNEHFQIDLGSGPVPLQYGEINFLAEKDAFYLVVDYSTGDLATAPPRSFPVRFDPFMKEVDGRSGLLLIGRDFQSGVFNNEYKHLLVYKADAATQNVSLEKGSWLTGFRGVVGLGAEHIKIGTDHIMFVLVLLLPSVLVFGQNKWTPARGFLSSLWRVAKIATSFTIAHSFTLTLGGLGIVSLPGRLVEFTIAISIALAALHNLRPVFANREWAIAFGFGLFHGFGFASLLDGLGLGKGERVSSILGFNLGVELGQLFIIAMVFPILFVLRRTKYYLNMMRAVSIALVVLALGWAAERLLGKEFGISSAVDPIVQFPRVTGLLMILAVVACAVYLLEKRKSALLALD
jgi:hypothetical protein